MIGAAGCLEEAGEVDCYEVSGANAILGERVRFVAEEVPVDPTDRSKGMHSVLVHLESAQETR
jgi:hypothetical protein